ncbi:MAG: response regulator [Syntrophaceae bacterium]|nr:response regulator [Syntrophaceae bacterium]
MNKKERKLLVVDDNIDFVHFIRRALEQENYRISIALDGKTAIEKASTENPELILLDMKLPDISGEEVLERVKEINKGIPVMVITGYGGDQLAIDMMRKGAVDFLTKPLEPRILIKAIKNALAIHDTRQEDKKFNPYPSLEIFFPFLAHEIRNPLHAISGALAIIQKRCNLKDQFLTQSIKIIHEEVQRLNDFVQGCLNFVRPPDFIRFSEVNLREVISVTVSMLAHMFESESNKIEITVKADPDLPKVYVNYEEIKQAFLNIIKNAYEAMPEGGELSIEASETHESPKMIEVVFTDQGVGIKKEAMGSLFSPFYTNKPRGNGLGLALCRRIIVERHQGTIHIESEEKKGTTVKVKLPATRLQENTPGEAS